jgi:tRNA nucleotidyltransferase (CCA-adding enzyme)
MNIPQLRNLVFSRYPIIKTIVADLAKKNAIAVVVGGAVRDFFLDVDTKDFDIEVYHISTADLESILKKQGPVSLVGKSFGVFKLHGIPVDWSLPRKDSFGRKPEVIVDQDLSFHDAFIRRDLTINAMGVNLISGELIDLFGGKKDIEEKVLRAPDPTFFVQDPLRFYRVMQFIGRFSMHPDKELTKVCKKMDISTVSRERISEEFEKLLLKSERPSLGFRWLQKIERLSEIIPELYNLVGMQQYPPYHPEGDVFEHTMQTLDAAARIAKQYHNTNKKMLLLFSALCHDIGKTGGKTEYGHDKRGSELVKHILSRITVSVAYTKAVEKLVRYHMAPGQFIEQESKSSAYKRLARKLAPETNLALLSDLALADKQGRNPESEIPLSHVPADIIEFQKKAAEAQVIEHAEEPLLQGRDLLDVLKPGKQMGEVLKKAYEMQLQEGIRDKEILKIKILNLVKKDK